MPLVVCLPQIDSLQVKTKMFRFLVGYACCVSQCVFSCLSNAMHGQNINLPVCVCLSLCVSVTLSVTRLQVRPLNRFLQLIVYRTRIYARMCLLGGLDDE